MKPYKITVPVMSQNLLGDNLEKTLSELRRCKAERVFVAIPQYFMTESLQRRALSEMEKHVFFFRAHGFEVGVWLLSSLFSEPTPFTKLVEPNGQEHTPWCCHSGEDFLSFSAEYAKKIAAASPDLIMYDDDFHFYGYCGCRCKNHRQLFREAYGDDLNFDAVGDAAFAGAPNEERRMWLAVMGKSLEDYAARMRAAVDEVNPAIRMGFCVNQSNFGVEGTDLVKLSKILAGGTKPFARLIGAPYWQKYYETFELQMALETTRQELAELEGAGIELMTEGDVFPRPRTAIPAAYLECFDTILRADGRSEGILKYMLDYYAPADYETGYIDRHLANQPLYEAIHTHFSEKPAYGVRVYHAKERYAGTDLRYAFAQDKHSYMLRLCNSHEGRVLSTLSLPIAYDGCQPVGAAFGENARYLDDTALQNGLILDLAGAMALTERGVDVGLRAIGEPFPVKAECFAPGVFHRVGDVANVSDQVIRRIEVDETAEIESWYTDRLPWFTDGFAEMNKTPAAYRYENAAGQRFFVMAFLGASLPEVVYKSYGKSKQLREACEWLASEPLAAKCIGHPGLYMLCKQDADSLSVGLWNLSVDPINAPVVELADNYSSIEPIGCEGQLSGNAATLSAIPAFGFAGFVVRN